MAQPTTNTLTIMMKIGNSNSMNASGPIDEVWKAVELFKALVIVNRASQP